MAERPRVVLVEDDWPWMQDGTEDITHLNPSVEVVQIDSASDFIAGIPDFEKSPPNLFVVDIALKWTTPDSDALLNPGDYEYLTGGLFLHQEVSRHPEMAKVPFMFWSVLDFDKPRGLWQGEDHFAGAYFLSKVYINGEIGQVTKDILAGIQPRYARLLS